MLLYIEIIGKILLPMILNFPVFYHHANVEFTAINLDIFKNFYSK